MQAPFLPLFDPTLELDEDARRRIGLTTALLFVRRQEWVHRRVELVTFEDQDVIRRRNSVDFTLPHWTSEYLKVSRSEPSKIAVPIALFRKATLAHFNLSDEGSNAVPLLSGTQVGPLAELALLATAELILGPGNVHDSIAKDIRELTCDRRADDEDGRRPSSAAFKRLFSLAEPEPESRLLLKLHPIFLPLAEVFDDNYIAGVLLTIAGGDRRVIHFAYDEMISETGDEQVHRRRMIKELFEGNLSRRVLVLASSAGDAESFHMEAEAPEGLRISSRVTFTQTQYDARRRDIKKPFEKSGSYQRSHVHCNDVHASDRLAVVLRIGPRSSTIVRGAALTAALTLLAVVYVRIQIHHINKHGAASAATVLLVIPTILSLWVARSNEHPATTYLLWPVRIVAAAPAVLGLIAASVLITGATSFSGEAVLAAVISLLAAATWILGSTWRGAIRRQARRRSLRPRRQTDRLPSDPPGLLDQTSNDSAKA
jgi:hypothetical protein